MQNENTRSQARSLRDHLSQVVTAKQRELERKLNKSAATKSHDELFAEASREAVDLDYERWDGMS